MASQRTHRLAEQIHKEISALLVKGLKDPRIGFVTITAVEVAPDLRMARIYYTVVGDEPARKETEKGLKSSTPFIRRELGQRLRTRYVPDLLFEYDSSLEYGSRIESLIRELHEGDSHDQGDTEKD